MIKFTIKLKLREIILKRSKYYESCILLIFVKIICIFSLIKNNLSLQI